MLHTVSVLLSPTPQDTLRNPTVMDFMDSTLEDTDFTTKDILNFLCNGPEEQREAGMPSFDWRNIFNITDQIIRMFNRYGEVRNLSLSLCVTRLFFFAPVTICQILRIPRTMVPAFLSDRLSVPQTGASVFKVFPQESAARPPFET